QILKLRAPLPATFTPLKYPGAMPVSVGDRVVLISDSGPVTGTVTREASLLDGELKLDQPVTASAMSGAPIVLEATGTPVAILVTADNQAAATVIGFRPLAW